MGLLDSIDGAVRGAFCIAGSTLEGLSGLVSIIAPYDEETDDVYAKARQFRRLTCEDSGEEPDYPFSGGQCPGVAYSVTTSETASTGVPSPGFCPSGTQTIERSGNFWGPIGGIRFNTTASYSCPVGTIGMGDVEISCRGSTSAPILPDVSWVPIVSGVAIVGSPTIISVSRIDGLEDNCGNPPGMFPENPQIPSVDVNVEVSPNVFVPFTFVFAPLKIDVDGRIYAPVNISGTLDVDVNFDGKLILAPDVKFELDPDGFDPLSEPDDSVPPGVPGTPAQSDESNPDLEGETPDGQFLEGLLVELVSIPRSASVYKGGIYRGAYWVWQGHTNKLALCTDGRFSLASQFVFAPSEGCTNWRVLANHGYTVKVTPFFRGN